MDSGIHAWSGRSALHPGVDRDLSSADGDAPFTSGVVDSESSDGMPTQPVPLGYTNVSLDYQYSHIDAHNSDYAHGHLDVAPTPGDKIRSWTNAGPQDLSFPSNRRLDYQHSRIGVGQNPSSTAPFPPASDHAQARAVFSTRYSPDEVHHRPIARLPSVQYPLSSSSLPAPDFDAPTLLCWLMNMAQLQEMHLREVWRYMTSRTEDDVVASVWEAERLDPRRPHPGPLFSRSTSSHSSRSSTRNPTSIAIGHGAEMPPALRQTQAYAMGGYKPDATRPSFTDPNCVPQHDAEQERYMFSYHTHVSPFPQAVVGPYSNSPQNQTLPSSALILGSPFHPSAPDVSTSLPAPGVPSKVPNPKKKSKPGYCVNCYTTETSQWRRHPESKDQLCNYCGQKAYKGELLKQEPQ